MTSFFSWLDYSEQQKRQMLDVIDQFREQDTRDEIGIGSLRDAIADLLFPGTSTIQTRARYYLFVPWMYLHLEKKGVQSTDIASEARKEEIILIDALAESDNSDGTIGIQARKSLQRLPSNIYWMGLGRWGIRLFRGSQPQYHRSLNAFYAARRGTPEQDDDKEPVDGRVLSNWHPKIPEQPDGFPRKASFNLTKGEAGYVQERVMIRVPGTLLAFLMDRGWLTDRGEFPWEHPRYGDFPAHIREQLQHGRNFSEVIYGAVLLYNLMLAEKSKSGDFIEEYNGVLETWASEIENRLGMLTQWNRQRFWEISISSGARITPSTRLFVNTWLDLALLPGAAKAVAANRRARDLIRARERFLKRGQARLENPRALELWSGAAGTARLDYRWGIAQTIISDILRGLSNA